MNSNWRLPQAPVAFCALLFLLAGCQAHPEGAPTTEQTMPKPDINAVLRAHDQELMAIPGVVGVYVGLLPDQKTPCLKVMATKITRELKRAVPKSLEGYKVELEETGPIRLMKSG